MKKVKQISLVMLLSIFVFAASTVKAQAPKAEQVNRGDGIENFITDLTDQQKTEVEKLRVAHMKEAQQIKNQMDIKRAELKALQTVENPDMDAINKKIEEKAALRTELEKKGAEHKQAVRNILTNDQRVIYDQKMARHGNGMAAQKCGAAGKSSCCGGGKKGAGCGRK